MSRQLYCLLVREGTSDDGLISPLTALLTELGFDPYSQINPWTTAPDKTTETNLRHIQEQGQTPDIIFVHRDADNEGWEARNSEIHNAVQSTEISSHVVPVIPVKMTEAWILHAMHNPDYRQSINLDLDTSSLPSEHSIPTIAAKEKLREIHRQVFPPQKRRSTARFETDRTRWIHAIQDTSYLEGCDSFNQVRESLLAFNLPR